MAVCPIGCDVALSLGEQCGGLKAVKDCFVGRVRAKTTVWRREGEPSAEVVVGVKAAGVFVCDVSAVASGRWRCGLSVGFFC